MELTDIDEISSEIARQANDSFMFNESVFLFDDRARDDFFDERVGFEQVVSFTMPELQSMQHEASRDDLVIERREKAIENKVRASSIFNEGVRYGAQYGFSHTLSQFNTLLKKSEVELRRTYDFGALMIGGGIVVPPVISESENTVEITDNSYTHVRSRYDVRSEARFSRVAPTFLDYIILPSSEVSPPSKFSIPLTKNELTHWSNGVYEGWIRGRRMAHDEITSSINRLTRDYLGMVRFHVLLKYGIVNEPIVTRQGRGVLADDTGIDIGVTTIHLNKMQSFNAESHLWKALPKIDKLEREYLND